MLRKQSMMGLVLAMVAILSISAVWAKEGRLWTSEARIALLSPADGRLVVSMSVAREGDRATYSITLRNPGDVDIKDLFIAGAIAQGTTFLEAGLNPAKGGFRGIEGGNAVFLSDVVSARGWQAFSYKVKLSGDTADPVWAWVHWRQPVEGTGLSGQIRVLPSVTAAILASASVGTLPQEPLIWRVAEVHEPAQKSEAPSTSQFARMSYQFEGVRILTQEGVTTAYNAGSAYFVKGGAPALSAVRGDTPARIWVFTPLPSRLQDEGVAAISRVLFKSEELKGLRDGPYTITLSLVEAHPGGSTPTHFHPGPTIVYVLEGTVIHNLEAGSAVYGPGSIFIEQAGEWNSQVYPGPGVAKLLSVRLVPEGEPATTFPGVRPHPWTAR